MNVAAVVVAAGRGERAGGGMPKQYRTIAGVPVIRLALLNLTRARVFSAIQPVVHGDRAIERQHIVNHRHICLAVATRAT